MAERVIKETTTHKTSVSDSDTDEPVVERGDPNNLVERIIWFVTGAILVLLAFRWLFSMLGANRGNSIADFVYDTSNPLVAPFFGLFNYSVVDYGAARFEVYTVVAMLAYAAIAWGLTYLATINRPR